MIPNASAVTQVGDLGGEKIEMSFDEDSIVHLMGVLTNMYSDAQLACIREYSTNARDEHIKHNPGRPIEVSLPNRLHPYLVIRDFGIGLSLDDIKKIYSKYGASTKRDSNDFNGMLGIGGKSALAYTGQFMITSFHGGKKFYVSVTRANMGAPVMEILGTSDTDEPTGVEISIPVATEDHGSFQEKASNFFQFWSTDDVKVAGIKAPKPILEFDNFRVFDSANYWRTSPDYVLMGGVTYPLRDKIISDQHGKYVVVEVPNGTVQFTPSREALEYTPFTVSAIDLISAQFRDALIAEVTEKIALASDYSQARTTYNKWFDNNERVFWRGQPLHTLSIFGARPWGWSKDKPFETADKTRQLDLSSAQRDTFNADRAVYVTNFTKAMLTRKIKAQAGAWMASNLSDKTNTTFYFLPPFKDEDNHLSWLVNKVDFATLAKIEVTPPKKAKAGVKPVMLYVHSKGDTDINTLDGRQVVYYTGDDTRGNQYRNLDPHDMLRRATTEIQESIWLVRATPTKVKAVLEAHPNALHWKAWINSLVDEWKATLTETQLFILAGNSGLKFEYDEFSRGAVDDPDFDKMVRTFKSITADDRKVVAKGNAIDAIALGANLGYGYATRTLAQQNNPQRDLDTALAARYPLATGYGHNKHKVLYINAAYKARQAGVKL